VGDLGGISSGQETYRIALSMRIFIPFFYLFALVVAVGFLGDMSSSDQGGLLFFILWCIGLVASGWWTLLRMPWRVRTDDRGIHFLARTRTIDIPWDRLRSVSSPWYDLNRNMIRWRWDGRSLRTMGPWEHQHRLLTMIEQHAPQVDVLL
jgi:hypothetical protein